VPFLFKKIPWRSLSDRVSAKRGNAGLQALYGDQTASLCVGFGAVRNHRPIKIN